MFLAFLIGCLVVQVWAWRSVGRRLQSGTITRLQGAWTYAGWAFLPLLLFVGGFAAMVGIEEWLQIAVIEERAVLLAFPVFVLSVLGTVVFIVRCCRQHG